MSNSGRPKISVKTDLFDPTVGISIKQEPGVGTLRNSPGANSSGRLSSFRTPRDLTLGGQTNRKPTRKVYTPNLVATRAKKESPTAAESSRGRGRGRGRTQSERGRGRGRQNSNLVQSAGVFSEGTANALKKGYSSGYSRDETTIAQKPVLNLKKEIKVDLLEEQEHLKLLLGDIENCVDQSFVNFGKNPSVLFASEAASMAKGNIDNPISIIKYDSSVVIKREVDDDGYSRDYMLRGKMDKQIPVIKQEPGVVIKQEVDDDGNVPELGVASLGTTIKIQDSDEIEYKTLSELFSDNPPLFLFQFPDALPGQGPDIVTTNQSGLSKGKSSKQTTKCTLRDLGSGVIGKVIMYKSGKVKLKLGESVLDLDIGTRTSFLQELMSINVNTRQRNGRMISLGRIQTKVVATPDWDTLLG